MQLLLKMAQIMFLYVLTPCTYDGWYMSLVSTFADFSDIIGLENPRLLRPEASFETRRVKVCFVPHFSRKKTLFVPPWSISFFNNSLVNVHNVWHQIKRDYRDSKCSVLPDFKFGCVYVWHLAILWYR